MQAYTVEKVITQDGKIQLDTLPFSAGETVQIIVLPSKQTQKQDQQPLLRGSVVAYIDPLEPVVHEDGAALQ